MDGTTGISLLFLLALSLVFLFFRAVEGARGIETDKRRPDGLGHAVVGSDFGAFQERHESVQG